MKDALNQAPWLSKLAQVFDKGGKPLYLVGGAVRNPLMGLPISDVDICGPALPEEVCALCEGTEVNAVLRAAHFGTVELHVTDEDGGRHMAEYTTFREDSYRCGHKPEEVKFTDDIEVDCYRRDFSVNAMYQQLFEDHLGDVIDPTGGLLHMRQGVLHTVTPKPEQVLKDDGLRILRAVRFQAEMDLTPTDGLMNGLCRFAHLLADIAPERLRDEWQKILLADLRYPQLKRKNPATLSGLKTMYYCGARPYVTGEMDWCGPASRYLDGTLPRGEEDRAEHGVPIGGEGWMMKRLEGCPLDEAVKARIAQACEEDPVSPMAARMALLLCQQDATQVRARMLHLRFANREAAQTESILRLMHSFSSPGPSTVVLAAEAGLSVLTAAVCLGSLVGKPADVQYSVSLLEQLCRPEVPLTLRELQLDGRQAAQLVEAAGLPSPYIGRVLHTLWTETLTGAVENTTEALTGRGAELLAMDKDAMEQA